MKVDKTDLRWAATKAAHWAEWRECLKVGMSVMSSAANWGIQTVDMSAVLWAAPWGKLTVGMWDCKLAGW